MTLVRVTTDGAYEDLFAQGEVLDMTYLPGLTFPWIYTDVTGDTWPFADEEVVPVDGSVHVRVTGYVYPLDFPPGTVLAVRPNPLPGHVYPWIHRDARGRDWRFAADEVTVL